MPLRTHLAPLLSLSVACRAPRPAQPVRIAVCQILIDADREAAFARIDAALAQAAAWRRSWGSCGG